MSSALSSPSAALRPRPRLRRRHPRVLLQEGQEDGERRLPRHPGQVQTGPEREVPFDTSKL